MMNDLSVKAIMTMATMVTEGQSGMGVMMAPTERNALRLADAFLRELQNELDGRGVEYIVSTETGEVIGADELARVRGILTAFTEIEETPLIFETH